MIRLLCTTAVLVAIASLTTAQTPDKKAPKKPLPAVLAPFLKMDAKQFMARYDTDKDQAVSLKEAPAFLSRAFAVADENKDEKVNAAEVERLLTLVGRFAQANNGNTPAKKKANPEFFVRFLLNRYDTNKDDKIHRKEAKDRLADTFDRLDTNKDMYLDRKELLVLAQRIAATQRPGGGRPGTGRPGQPIEFDALDLDADGRLSRKELQDTPLAKRFDEIDTDKSMEIDRSEWRAFAERSRPQATPKEKAKDVPKKKKA